MKISMKLLKFFILILLLSATYAQAQSKKTYIKDATPVEASKGWLVGRWIKSGESCYTPTNNGTFLTFNEADPFNKEDLFFKSGPVYDYATGKIKEPKEFRTYIGTFKLETNDTLALKRRDNKWEDSHPDENIKIKINRIGQNIMNFDGTKFIRCDSKEDWDNADNDAFDRIPVKKAPTQPKPQPKPKLPPTIKLYFTCTRENSPYAYGSAVISAKPMSGSKVYGGTMTTSGTGFFTNANHNIRLEIDGESIIIEGRTSSNPYDPYMFLEHKRSGKTYRWYSPKFMHNTGNGYKFYASAAVITGYNVSEVYETWSCQKK